MTWELLKSYLTDIKKDILAWEKRNPDHVGAWLAVLGVLLFFSSKLIGWFGIVMIFGAVGYMIYRLATDKH